MPAKGQKHTDEAKAKLSEAAMGNTKWLGKHHSEETKRKISEAKKGTKASDETKRKMSEAAKGHHRGLGYKHTEEAKAKMSEARLGNKNCVGHKHTDETRKKMSESHKNISEETRQKLSEAGIGNKNTLGYKHTPETKVKMSKAAMGNERASGNKLSIETRLKMSESRKGEKNPAWMGGISYGDYCAKFNPKFKEKIRAKYNYRCFLCGKTTKENGRRLSVHHVNFNKDCLCDNSDCKFVPVCINCHNKTSNNRDYWELMIMYMIENNYSPKQRKFSLINLDD